MTRRHRDCDNCKFWEAIKGRSWEGECRRNAPVEPVKKDARAWAVTEHDDWCGEWEART